LGGIAAGAVVGGAIARSTYYGGDAYPYYGEGFAYDSGGAGDFLRLRRQLPWLRRAALLLLRLVISGLIP
jgi:hypothetical protein